MPFLEQIASLKRVKKSIVNKLWIRTVSPNIVIIILAILFVASIFVHKSQVEIIHPSEISENSAADAADIEVNNSDVDINNFGSNFNVLVNKSRYRDVPRSGLKNILFWNDAYGVREYDVGSGQEHFYTNLCPDTRCYTTSNRSYLASVEDFDAVVIHQRGIEWDDMPKTRRPEQW
jgi:hypothetical protein